jgi:hypothetical protein
MTPRFVSVWSADARRKTSGVPEILSGAVSGDDR